MVWTLDNLWSRFDMTSISPNSRAFRIEHLLRKVLDNNTNLSNYIDSIINIKDGILTFVYFDEHWIQKTFHMKSYINWNLSFLEKSWIISLSFLKDEPLELLKDFIWKYVYIDLWAKFKYLIMWKISSSVVRWEVKLFFFIDDLHKKREDRFMLFPEKTLIDYGIEGNGRIIKWETHYGQIPFVVRDVSEWWVWFYIDVDSVRSKTDLENFLWYNWKTYIDIKWVKPFKLFVEVMHKRELKSWDKKYHVIWCRFVDTKDNAHRDFHTYISLLKVNS